MSLRREVITDPIQISPVTEQVRSVMPWWRRWICAILLSGCTTEPTHTLGDAAQLVAQADCSRWITCGTDDSAWRDCVDSLVWEFCKEHDCAEAYPDWDYDEVEACTDWYMSVPCERHVEACYL